MIGFIITLLNIIIIFERKFGFRAGHSTNHSLLELIDQKCERFDKKKYFLRIFVDLSKAFDTIDYEISCLEYLSSVCLSSIFFIIK